MFFWRKKPSPTPSKTSAVSTPTPVVTWWQECLACPICRGPLIRNDLNYRCEQCCTDSPIVEGRPVFIPDPQDVKVISPEHLSNQLPPNIFDWVKHFEGRVLNLGAGGTQTKLPNVCEVEYSIFRHTDVVADAHRLPFHDGAFDAVVTMNTFEHLSDPEQAASEVYRVLKPGGKLYLHTAFLQPVHEPPYHFYNATEFGVRRWFRDFEIANVSVSENFNPAYVLSWLSWEILQAVEQTLGASAARKLADTKLDFWRHCWVDRSRTNDVVWTEIMRRIPEEIQRRFSAGFHLEASKPRRSAA